MPPPPKTWVRQVREAAKLTQDEFGAKLGAPRETVAKWEEPGGSKPNHDYTQKIHATFPQEVATVGGLRLVPPSATPSQTEVANLPSELAQAIAFLADRLATDQEKVQLLLEVKKFVQMRVSNSRPPTAT